MDDFIPTRSPQKRLIEFVMASQFRGCLLCGLGLFPGHLAGRFQELLIAGLYIAKCGTSESETVRQLSQA